MKQSRIERVGAGVLFLLVTSLAAGQILSPPIVKKTVGTSASGCASQNLITVLPGTDVYFCYTITNPSEVPLEYNLTDNVLGNIGSGLVDSNSTDTIDGVLETVNHSVTNTATWFYSDTIGNASPQTLSAAARLKPAPAVSGEVEDSATVEVVDPVPTLTDAGMLLFGIAIVGVGVLLLRRSA